LRLGDTGCAEREKDHSENVNSGSMNGTWRHTIAPSGESGRPI